MKKFLFLLLAAQSAFAANIFNVPVNFVTGSSIDVLAGVPLTGTWDFSAATVVLPDDVLPTVTLSGGVTGSGTTSIVTTVAVIPDLVSAPGSIVSTNIAAPTAPASGKTKWYTDSTAKRFHDRNDAGVVGTTVVADAGASNQFITAISTSGVISKAQPSFSNLSSSIGTSQGGLATGGTTGQTLVKTSGTNYATDWTSLGGVSSVTTTVDQTATTETAHVTHTVPANSAVVGTTYRITAFGNIDNGTSVITFTPHIRWGGTGGVSLLATPTIVGTTSAQSDKTWSAEAYVTIRTIGATGTAVCSLSIENHTADSSGAYSRDNSNSGATPVVIDTTLNKDLDLTWALSATTGTPHIRTLGGTVEVVKP